MKVKEIYEVNKYVDIIEYEDGSIHSLVVYKRRYNHVLIDWDQDKESLEEFGLKINQTLIELNEESIINDLFNNKPKIKYVKKKKNKRDIKNERKNLKRGKKK